VVMVRFGDAKEFFLGFFKSVRVDSQRNQFGFAVGVCLGR
jgi:hypothetical protein